MEEALFKNLGFKKHHPEAESKKKEARDFFWWTKKIKHQFLHNVEVIVEFDSRANLISVYVDEPDHKIKGVGTGTGGIEIPIVLVEFNEQNLKTVLKWLQTDF
jgi:hypothetical protein